MKIRCETTVEDIQMFIEHHIKHKQAQGLGLKILVSCIAVMVSIGYLVYRDSHRPDQAVAWGGATGVVSLALIWWALRRLPAKLAQRASSEDRSGNTFGWHTIELTPEGITESSESSKTSHQWRGIEEIWLTESHVFIYVGLSLAHVIRREFAAEEFVQELRKRLSVEKIRCVVGHP